MSYGQDSKASRAAALSQLKFRKTRKTSPAPQDIITTTSSLSSTTSHNGAGCVPLQSRDATASSRFFTSTPPSARGTVLVPNSSPIPYDSTYRPHHLRNQDIAHTMPSIPGLNHANSWVHSSGQFGLDPLSAPSGFILGNTQNASVSRPPNGTARVHDGVGSAGTPEPSRKRGHRDDDPMDLFNGQGSPDIQRPGQKRKLPRYNAPDAIGTSLSFSSDESMAELSNAGPSTARIVRGGQLNANHREASSPKEPFEKFRITFMEYEHAKLCAAWEQAGHDTSAATALVRDPNFVWTAPSTSAETGRVKERNDATKAQRAAAKEKGKKSAIYAGRQNLNTKSSSEEVTTSPLKRSIDIPPSPLTPITLVVGPCRKKLKRMVESDEEEDELPTAQTKVGRLQRGAKDEMTDERRTLNYFSTTSSPELQQLTGCTEAQATAIINLRPFESVDDLNTKLGQGKKKAGPAGISPRMFEDCVRIFRGYGAVDDVLEQCERIGAGLRATIASWSSASGKGKQKAGSVVSNDTSRDPSAMPDSSEAFEEGATSLRHLALSNNGKPKDFLTEQPRLLSSNIKLKEYQLLGVNWLRLLYREGYSCILADEMGLGKTAQVISFFAYLKEQGCKGPHLIVVPSSTLENWVREFDRFAPSISVQTYYGSKDERPMLRQNLMDTQLKKKKGGWEVLITTYNLASGDDKDRKFLRKMEWDACVFDEGHVLKNFESQRYQSLMRNESRWRLLLTGTPLQNNLQELVSLMNFILPTLLSESLDSLRAVFKAKGDVTLLAQERVSRAKKMMTPFVMRRRKDQVLKELPMKTERIEWCDMSATQRAIYDDALQRSRKTVFDLETPTPGSETPATNGRSKPAKKTKATARTKDKMYLANSANILMDLRKAASHPMLFRKLFTDKTLDAITKALMKEPDFRKRGAIAQLVKEDMEVMTDAELQVFLLTYRSTQKFLQDSDCYLQAGKIKALLKLLEKYQAANRRILIFSQFTQVLDILQVVLNQRHIKHLVLTGSTPVDVRQSLVDEFTEDESIPVFLLSTKAGGMGINLTAASVVIIFDQDFNPHNDRQAQDRAYRIGQKQDVDVIKLITRGTIEEDMLRLGQTKLALDEAVAGDPDGEASRKTEKDMETSLMRTLRKQLAESELDGDKPGEAKDDLE
ncbi:hypothetical protein EVG20_g65 [Dentipellis fragilis]|uniref:DNA helicase n=1 Tax=Dentipellis fragilis TaxID=205917 RepID=A0A4Y9ZFI5_9AGAM|nr:hypothetical protein EVG20_g65 [Dentipellis fragilis]